MALGKRLINTGAVAACNTDSVQAFGADAAFSSNVALYQLDSDGGTTNNVPDTTGNYNGTASNVTYATGQFGNAAEFNGSSSKIALPNVINFSTGEHTISAWINTTSTSVTRFISNLYTGTVPDGSIDFVWIPASNSISVDFSIGGSNYTNTITGISTGQWYHIAATFVNNGTCTAYLNGSSVDTVIAPSFTATAYQPLNLGYYERGNNYWSGSIDEVRIFDKALSAEDVATLYAETSSTASNTNPFSEGSGVALYTMDYDASEASGYYDGTPTDVTFGVGGKINYGARFNGSSSKVTTSLDFDTLTDYTISMWIKIDASPTARDFFAGTLDSSAKNGIYLANNTDETIRFYERNASGDTMTITSTDTINIGSWNHIVAVRDGNTDYLYINNGTPVSASNSTITHATGFTFGIAGAYATYFDGDIDQVRIFSKALNQSEVASLFAETACVYTSTTDIVNYPTGTTPVAYYKLDNSSEDFSTGGNDGTDTNIEYRFGRFGQAAVFNGSNSKIDTGISSISSPFAVSMWINEDVLDSGVFFGNWNSTAADMYWQTTSDGRLRISIDGYSQEYFGTAGDVKINTWHHIAVTLSGGSYEVYLDGNSLGTSTTSVTTFSSGQNFMIGNSSKPSTPLPFDGLIDQVRIYSTALSSSQVTELYNEKPETDTSNFKTVLYEGNGTTNYISNVGMDLETDGGLVWVKSRDTAYHHRLVDSVRGLSTDGVLFSNRTNAAEDLPSATDNFTSFDKNGFTLGSTSSTNGSNFNGDSFVAWVWKGGGDAVTGSSSQATNVSYSANQDAGFSIVKFTSSTSTSTPPPMNYISHGLNSPVEMTIYKRLDTTQNWVVQHKDLDQAQAIYLDLSNAAGTPNTSYSFFDNTSQTGNIGVRSNFAISRGAPYIAYCFHSVSGYSKIGSYSGTGVNGNRVYLDSNGDGTGTGAFEPRWLLVKRTNTADNWVIVDSVRGLNNSLFPDDSSQELSNSGAVSFNTDGFTVNGNSGGWNNGTSTYLYMAFK